MTHRHVTWSSKAVTVRGVWLWRRAVLRHPPPRPHLPSRPPPWEGGGELFLQKLCGIKIRLAVTAEVGWSDGPCLFSISTGGEAFALHPTPSVPLNAASCTPHRPIGMPTPMIPLFLCPVWKGTPRALKWAITPTPSAARPRICEVPIDTVTVAGSPVPREHRRPRRALLAWPGHSGADTSLPAWLSASRRKRRTRGVRRYLTAMSSLRTSRTRRYVCWGGKNVCNYRPRVASRRRAPLHTWVLSLPLLC